MHRMRRLLRPGTVRGCMPGRLLHPGPQHSRDRRSADRARARAPSRSNLRRRISVAVSKRLTPRSAEVLTTKGPVRIAPADGKLGVLLPGIGAVSTTFIAGVEAVKRGLGAPIGSLTQLATVRLGKRTEGRSPLIKDFVPLANLDDLVFGGWDIYEDNAYEAAKNAGVLETALLEKLREPLEALHPMAAGFDQEYVRRIHGPNVKEARSKMDKAEMLMEDIRHFQKRTGVARTVMVWCG